MKERPIIEKPNNEHKHQHYFPNPDRKACVKCRCGQWFRWDYEKHKYIPI